MAEPIYLLLGIHHHQPVGNFDGVFQRAFESCYRPLVDALERHPNVKISLHHSGPLLDWALEREGDYLGRVAELAKRGQIEILGGGYYEPILPILKPMDALGQIEMMQKFWEWRMVPRPRGMWLAERVWEPSLAALISDAGMEFTILDDQHFRMAGMVDEYLFGFYRTERAGKSVSIFPSDKMLRYMIPFKEPQDVIGHLLYLQEKFPGKAITYGDDGEKFGVWPGTYDWVIVRGWLERFLDELEKNSDRIKTITFSEYMQKNKSSGTVYLPTASYGEMLEWAMPARAILEYERTKKSIEDAGLWSRAAPFFRGGFWDNFLTKYPESNLIHKRALYTSDRIDAAESKGRDLAGARRSLYRAQCNCAYWHGLFGGLYLNYLRHALYQNLIDADLAVDESGGGLDSSCRIEIADIDCDGSDEVIMADKTLSLMIKPSSGGGIAALDIRPKRFNLLNTLARRFEAYHEPRSPEGHGGGVASIHDIGKDMGDLKKFLIYDRAPRYAFLEHAFENEPDWQAVLEGRMQDVSMLDNASYEIKSHKKDRGGASVALSCLSNFLGGALKIEKEYRLVEGGGIVCDIKWHSGSKRPPEWVATEINFTLLAGHDNDRFYKWEGAGDNHVFLDSKQILGNVSKIEAHDRAYGFCMTVKSEAQKIVLSPVETVSQSEKGFDRIYQGSNMFLAWRPKWSSDGNAEFSVGINVDLE